MHVIWKVDLVLLRKKMGVEAENEIWIKKNACYVKSRFGFTKKKDGCISWKWDLVLLRKKMGL